MTRVRLPLAALAFLALTALLPAAASPKLADSASTFIRSQAGSPINWELWGPDAAARAKAEGKPVYIFIGSFLSELSRATTQQSFAQPDNIKYLNDHFICVIVDRDEQSDVAACAQYYLQSVKQTSGWPAHLWLTPELLPYEGGSYLPPTEEWGKTSFSKQARQAGETWTSDPATCRQQAKDALATIAAATGPIEPLVEISAAALDEKLAKATAAWRETFDAAHGGFGTSPKNPEPELLRFLLRRSPEDRDAALKTLRAMLASPLRDPLDGGFFRYATDASWRVPYLQKTLADQARLALALLDAAELTNEPAFADAARGALDYAVKQLAKPDGTFAAAEDATGEDRLGYFAWTEAEIDAALGADSAPFKKAFGVQTAGNVSADDDPGGKLKEKNLLFRVGAPGEAAAEKSIAASLEKLRAARAKKPAPLRDDRATAGAHGLMLAALSRAGAQLNDKDFVSAAARVFDAAQKQFVVLPEVGLGRLSGSTAAAAPSDYAALALGCREYAKAAKKSDADALANKLLARVNALFFDAAQGHYFASPATLPTGIFVRAPAAGDVPSAEALAVLAGTPADSAIALRKALAATLVGGMATPGDVLLALSLK